MRLSRTIRRSNEKKNRYPSECCVQLMTIVARDQSTDLLNMAMTVRGKVIRIGLNISVRMNILAHVAVAATFFSRAPNKKKIDPRMVLAIFFHSTAYFSPYSARKTVIGKNTHFSFFSLDFDFFFLYVWIFTWSLKVMDIHISGMFLNLSQPNRHVHWDGIRHNEQPARLPTWWQQQNVVDLDHFDGESVVGRMKNQLNEIGSFIWNK